jgi:hypothetical protein
MTRSTAVLDRLRAANPVDAAAPVPPAELVRIEADVRAARAAGAIAPAPRARWAHIPRLALAGSAAALSVAAVLVATLSGGGVSPARAAYVAFAAPTGVFHTVAKVTVEHPGQRASHAWVESWTTAHGGRSRDLQYNLRPGGRRGGLVSEACQSGNSFGSGVIAYGGPSPGGEVGLSGVESSTGDPRLAYLEAYRHGRVRDAGTATVPLAGRPHRAWRLVAEERVTPRVSKIYDRRVHVPGFVARTTFLVDVRTRALLVAQHTGLVVTPHGYVRQTTIRRFLRFDRVHSRAGLRPSPRFRREMGPLIQRPQSRRSRHP